MIMSHDASVRTLWDVKAPMRDGVRLSADVYLPDGEDCHPAILWRTPYDNSRGMGHYSPLEIARFFASKGYAFVIQDIRGRCDSEGEWYPFFNEGPDGYDTIEWIAKQPWCDGKIGMMGGSYAGWVQWAAARLQPPHLTTMVSTAAGGYWMREFPFVNGVPCLWFLAWLHLAGGRTLQSEVTSAVDWRKVFYHLPLSTMDEAMGRANTVWKEWLRHPNLDDFWRKVLLDPEDFARINVPTLHITGWYDGDQPGALFFYEGMVRHSPAKDSQHILIGPWDHGGTRTPKRQLGGVDFTQAALVDINRVHLDWFDRWLKGKASPASEWKKTRYFVMGDNRWAGQNDPWPPANIDHVKYHLHSDGRANTMMGDGELSMSEPGEEQLDGYTYDPEDPVVTVMDIDLYGGRVETPLDNRFILRRDDVLVYTSYPLKEAMTMSGRPLVVLYASSDCVDTDWFATLSDVHTDGRSIGLGGGLLRASYRNSLEKPELMKPGEIYRFVLELTSTCITFHREHRIRLSVTSSAFPSFARNLNTGRDNYEDTEIKVAHNTLHHDRMHPSHLLLPIKRGDSS